MDTSNKTIYFIDGDMDSPPPPPMPDSEESKRWFKEAWAVELLEFAGDSAKGLTGPGGEGIVARGFGGRDMIWGGDKETEMSSMPVRTSALSTGAAASST